MSDPESRQLQLTGRGGLARDPEGVGEQPLESCVVGSIEARRETSALELGGINVDQLALALAERLKPVEVELPMFGELVEGWLEHIRPKREIGRAHV